MIAVYVALIRAGRRTLEQVPISLRASVEAALNSEQ
ncbi:MAG: CD1375 family protein [Clostridia bacterium]|nr:CD1375 family protein [Clostridiales bacterium]MDU7504556.1 CD1375 family protein [Clostridia bacterium]